MTDRSSSTLTLRYFDGCPNWRVAHERIEDALRQIDAKPRLVLEKIGTAEEAERAGFRGSPTILVDGVDPFAEPEAPAGLSCRIYRTDAGVEGSPSVDQLVSVLQT